jgi:lipoyl synthase
MAHPPWLKIKHRNTPELRALKEVVASQSLATVCQEASCPNLYECWSDGTATFMLMGDTCTRGCRFCHVSTGNPQGWLDNEEPQKLANTIAKSGWKYVVLTAVDRDDLSDGGASHLKRCVEAVLKASPDVVIEVLAPDFAGQHRDVETLVHSGVHVFAHNVETVSRLQATARDRRASYPQSLNVLGHAKQVAPHLITKTSLMLGLGETDPEIRQTLEDLRKVGVDAITFGQYLRPSSKQLEVVEWVHPDQFEAYKKLALEDYGFAYCASGPLVRSSYRAGEYYLEAMARQRINNPVAC